MDAHGVNRHRDRHQERTHRAHHRRLARARAGAGARAGRARLESHHRCARRRAGCAPCATSWRAITHVAALAGDVDRPRRTGAALAVLARGHAGPRRGGQQRRHPRPEPAAARCSTTRSTRSSRSTCANVIAPLALIQAAARRAQARRADRQRHERRRRERRTPAGAATASSKAALEQLSAVLAAENPDLRVYWVDPGDMRTDMHQAAFPGEDISDRPLPETRVPGFVRAARGRPAERAVRRPARAGRGARGERHERAAQSARTRTTHGRATSSDARGDEPPEARGLARDEVRLLVSRTRATTLITHASLPRPAGLPERRRRAGRQHQRARSTRRSTPCAQHGGRREPVELHLSTPVARRDRATWVVELRRLRADGTAPLLDARRGRAARACRGGAIATLRRALLGRARTRQPTTGVRLWVAELDLPGGVLGATPPVRLADPLRLRARTAGRSRTTRPSSRTEPGSAEMPSAGRAFTPELVVARLERGGVQRRAAGAAHRRGQSGDSTKPPYRGVLPRAARTADAGERGARGAAAA